MNNILKKEDILDAVRCLDNLTIGTITKKFGFEICSNDDAVDVLDLVLSNLRSADYDLEKILNDKDIDDNNIIVIKNIFGKCLDDLVSLRSDLNDDVYLFLTSNCSEIIDILDKKIKQNKFDNTNEFEL